MSCGLPGQGDRDAAIMPPFLTIPGVAIEQETVRPYDQ